MLSLLNRNTWNHIIVYKLLLLSNRNTWHHIIIYNLLLNRNTWNLHFHYVKLSLSFYFRLTVPDLSPNIGIFWYFFTEMFEHFRIFFLFVFQINAVIYTVPLAVRLREQPIFLMYILTFLTGVFKSYPSYSDVSILLALLPLWKHLFACKSKILFFWMELVFLHDNVWFFQ